MNRQQRGQFEVFLRTRDFGPSYLTKFPGSSKAAEVFDVVGTVVAEIEAQEQLRAQAFRDGRKGKAEAKAALFEWMRKIVRSSKDVGRTGAGSLATLQMPRSLSDTALLAAARTMIEVGRPFSAQFIELGLPADWETAFAGAIDAFAQRMLSRNVGRHSTADANAALNAAIRKGRSALRTLDTIVANSLENDPGAMAAWLRSREQVGGRWRAPKPSPAESTTPEGAAAGEAVPAAVPESEVLKQAS